MTNDPVITIRGYTVRIEGSLIRIEGQSLMTINEAEEFLFGSYHREMDHFYQFIAPLGKK